MDYDTVIFKKQFLKTAIIMPSCRVLKIAGGLLLLRGGGERGTKALWASDGGPIRLETCLLNSNKQVVIASWWLAEAVRGTAEAEETSAAGPHGGPVRLEVCPLNSNKQVAHHIRIIVKF
jgi:hypothetical protein